ncbi:hypothetical protein M378DRAFT_453116 [Amanita muscaria Koide BX008]|uniref:F-box domain-containing protein n=1 Tax=Amanita muscaria (strain Koide BX008) TaxID=946122 RepID=A0A0C2SRX0_AMAMK|nr:hypothetical protein M378DRAFT_453116 [Amanita muscaria Koide BX008]
MLSGIHAHLNEMASPALPQDVFDEIISQLDDETSTLKSCSLVCRSFRRNAQKMLFNYTVVRLTYDNSNNYEYQGETIGPSQPIILGLIVKHAPHLIEYIQEIRISCFKESYAEFDDGNTADLANALGVFSRKEEFPINLRSLSLRFASERWDQITPCLERALVLLMSVYSLRHIFLHRIIDCPAHLFQNLPPLLKHLSLTNVVFSSLPTTRKALPALESLTVAFFEGWCRFDNAVERIVNTTQLKAFEGRDCTPYSMQVFEQILRPASNSLEHLKLRAFC